MKAPGALRWFVRVLVGFVRRELAAAGDYRMALIVRLFGFVFVVGSLLFLSRFVGAAANPHLDRYAGNYLGFAAIGFLAAEFQQVGVSGLSQRIRISQMMGTLEAEVATPAASWMVLGAPPIYEFTVALLRSGVYLAGATVLLGLDLSATNWLTVVIAVPLIGFAFSGLGLLAAGTTMLVRKINPVAMIIGSLSFFLSGVMYPVSVLPKSLQALGQFLPLTHALEVLRAGLLVGAGPLSVGESMFALALFAVILAPIGAGVFAYALRRARADGSLSHY